MFLKFNKEKETTIIIIIKNDCVVCIFVMLSNFLDGGFSICGLALL